MANLLNNGGKIAGLLFSRIFEIAGPPFGGTIEEYQELFKEKFDFKIFDACYNSFDTIKNHCVLVFSLRTHEPYRIYKNQSHRYNPIGYIKTNAIHLWQFNHVVINSTVIYTDSYISI
jgi:hypothetical protein